MLFACYRKFFTFGHALRNLRELRPRHGNGILGETIGSVAMSLFRSSDKTSFWPELA
jgi:hypothetical protein